MKTSKLLASSFIISAIILTTALFSQAQRSVSSVVVAEAERISKDKFDFIVETPKGALVYAVKKPNAE